MWHVVLDSNAVLLDVRPTEAAWSRLVRASRQARVRIYLPEIVVDELIAHRSSVPRPDVANAVAAVRALRDGTVDRHVERLLGGGESFEVVPYPTVPHREVAARALARRRPFDKLGHDGYRDVLVWESVLTVARAYPGGRVVLVSRNSKDFADADGGLHPDLRRDVAAIGQGATVELARDVAQLAQLL
jgi:hypothetical protein